MKIPNCQHAEVPKSKIVDYLVSLQHPEGGPKARFFLGWGFSQEHWDILASAFFTQANENDLASSEEGRHGTKYIVVALIQSPRGATPPIESIWMVATDKNHPRLITAYPES